MNCGRELLKGSTECLILCLVRNQPMYGYQIIKELYSKSNGYFRFKEGTLYPALHRLENNGLIKGKWERLLGSKGRRYYYITERGHKALNEKLATWEGFFSAINSIMLPST